MVITLANYAWIKPRRLVLTVADEAVATATPNQPINCTVVSVTILGRNMIGSAAGINGGAIDAYAQRALTFGDDMPAITASNNITVVVVNNGPAAVNMGVTIEGRAQQG